MVAGIWKASLNCLKMREFQPRGLTLFLSTWRNFARITVLRHGSSAASGAAEDGARFVLAGGRSRLNGGMENQNGR
jgi:hypothetical protein